MGNYGWELLSKYLIIQRENFNLFLYSEFSETKTNKLRKEIGIFAHIASGQDCNLETHFLKKKDQSQCRV